MGYFVRGLGFASVLVAACGGDPAADTPDAAAPDAGPVADASSSGDGGEPYDPNVYVESIARYGLSTGTPTDVKGTGYRLLSATAYPASAPTVGIVGSAREDGSFVLIGVPEEPYTLELRLEDSVPVAGDAPLLVRYDIDGARKVRLGSDLWQRVGTTAMQPTSQLALSVTAPQGFADGDSFSWIGLQSYLYRTAYYTDPTAGENPGQRNVPAAGATESSEWAFDGSVLDMFYGPDASGLPEASAGDDLVLIQARTRAAGPQVGSLDPWDTVFERSAIGMLSVPGTTFTNGGANLLSGTLAAPSRALGTVDVRGSTFATIRTSADYPDNVRTYLAAALTQETGTGPGLLTSIAPPSWEINVAAVETPVKPDCYAPDEACPETCTDGCSLATRYVDPGDGTHSFEMPRLYTSGLRDVYNATYYFSRRWVHPVTNQTISQSANATQYYVGTLAPFTLHVGPVRNLRLDEAALSWDQIAEVATTTPTIRFEAPELGSVDSYRVVVIELAPDAEGATPSGRPSRDVARLTTLGTSVTLPKDVLRANRYYYLRVLARDEDWSSAEPDVNHGDRSDVTGIFSAPFRVTAPN